MPRYYFHVKFGVDKPDDEGTDLPDDDAAWNKAVRTFPEMLREEDLKPGETYAMSVCLDDQSLIYELRLSSSTQAQRKWPVL